MGTLKKSEVPKERYLNRLEWMGNRYKSGDNGHYDWVPEVMITIDPAPNYYNKPVISGRHRRALKTQGEAHALFRNGYF